MSWVHRRERARGRPLALLGLLLASTAAGQREPLELSVPEGITGDGETVTAIRVVARTLAKGQRLADVRATVSAGTVRQVRPDGDHDFAVEWVAPHVAQTTQVLFAVEARIGARSVRVEQEIEVAAPVIRVSSVSSGGPLDLRGPDIMVLGRDFSTQLVLKQPEDGGVKLIANVGDVSPHEPLPDGRLAATYLPPEGTHPQVAIVAALDLHDRLLDWKAIPLYGMATVEPEASPSVAVRLRIGEVDYGPFRASEEGRVRATVLSPPGVSGGYALTRGADGTELTTPFDLGVLPFSRLLGACPDSGDRMTLLAVEPSGEPSQHERFEVEATRGWLSSPTLLGPGHFEAMFTALPDVKLGEPVVLRAVIRGQPRSSASCEIIVQRRAPTQGELSLAPVVYTAGSGTPIAIALDLYDAEHEPAQTVAVKFEPDLGEVRDVRSLPEGKVRALWILPDQLGGRRQALLSVETQSDPRVRVEASLPLKSGRTDRLSLEAGAPELRADGHSQTQLSIRAVDAHGNANLDAELRIDAEGDVGALVYDEASSAFATTYTAPIRYEPAADVLVVRDEQADIEATRPIALSPSRHRFALGPRVGVTSNLGRVTSLLLAADAAWRLPWFEPLTLGLETSFSWIDARDRIDQLDEELRTFIWVLPLLARASLQLPLDPFTLYAGAGLGTALVGSEVSSPSVGQSAGLQPLLAVSGHAGADAKLGPGRVVAEVGALWAGVDGAGLQGNVGGLQLSAGYRFEL